MSDVRQQADARSIGTLQPDPLHSSPVEDGRTLALERIVDAVVIDDARLRVSGLGWRLAHDRRRHDGQPPRKPYVSFPYGLQIVRIRSLAEFIDGAEVPSREYEDGRSPTPRTQRRPSLFEMTANHVPETSGAVGLRNSTASARQLGPDGGRNVRKAAWPEADGRGIRAEPVGVRRLHPSNGRLGQNAAEHPEVEQASATHHKILAALGSRSEPPTVQ